MKNMFKHNMLHIIVGCIAAIVLVICCTGVVDSDIKNTEASHTEIVFDCNGGTFEKNELISTECLYYTDRNESFEQYEYYWIEPDYEGGVLL